jgi:hypothetical protein
VVTDRVILDGQIRDTIKQFAQVGSTVTHADRAGGLRAAIEAGKKIIITTVQKFPFVYKEIGDAHRGNTFAIIIDEAHSSQGGQATGRMSEALAEAGARQEGETAEDAINRVMDSHKMRPRVRCPQGQQETPPLRREPRPRHPPQGRNHGRPLPRSRPSAQQDRRTGTGDGRHQQHRAGA